MITDISEVEAELNDIPLYGKTTIRDHDVCRFRPDWFQVDGHALLRLADAADFISTQRREDD